LDSQVTNYVVNLTSPDPSVARAYTLSPLFVSGTGSITYQGVQGCDSPEQFGFTNPFNASGGFGACLQYVPVDDCVKPAGGIIPAGQTSSSGSGEVIQPSTPGNTGSETISWTLSGGCASDCGPHAVITVPEAVTRGQIVRVDGSGSFDNSGSIQKYQWSYSPGADCPAGTALTVTSKDTGDTDFVSFTPLCSLVVKLTVTDNLQESDTATATVNVKARTGPSYDASASCTLGSHSCPDFHYVEDTAHGDPRTPTFRMFAGPGGPGSEFAINVNSCSDTTDPTPVFCPSPENGTYLNIGYGIKPIPNDGNEPFGGYNYIVDVNLTIFETGVFDPYMDANGPVPCKIFDPGVCAGENWYQANVKPSGKKSIDVAGFLAAEHRHEGMGDGHDRFSGHAIAAEGAYLSQDGNINRILEGLFQPDSAAIPLQKVADQDIQDAEAYINAQSNDCTLNILSGPSGRWTGELYFWEPPPQGNGHGHWVTESQSVPHCNQPT
jgi:hypothetical protein